MNKEHTTPTAKPERVKACIKKVGIYISSKMPKPLLAEFAPHEIEAAADQLLATK